MSKQTEHEIEEFIFRNSIIWIEYSHKRYLTPTEIGYRVDGKEAEFGIDDWEKTRDLIIRTRRLNSIPLRVDSIGKTFWLFPSDCIREKISTVENKGVRLYDKIATNDYFRNAFCMNAEVEEAITSAIYEGANSTRAKAKQLIAEGRQPKSKSEWMLVNNYMAMKWIYENSDKQIDLNGIKSLHAIVTKNTLDEKSADYSGKFRDDKVYVGEAHEGIEFSTIPDAIDEAIDLVTDNPRWIAPILRGILLHYFIAYIHPFFDGNGRTARVLFYYKAIRNDLKFVELVSISAHLKSHGKGYERAFERVVENDFDVTYFVDFCLDSLLFALDKAEEKVDYLLKIGKLRELFPLTDTQIMLLQKMALNKFRSVSIEEYAADISKSREHARKELKQLVDRGLLKEMKSGKKLLYLVEAKRLKKTVLELQ